MRPFQYDPYRNLLIYQDRALAKQPAIDITGEGRDLRMTGTIYAPNAEVKLAGNGDSITTQIISDMFTVQGNGTLNINYDADAFVKYRGTGLVQ